MLYQSYYRNHARLLEHRKAGNIINYLRIAPGRSELSAEKDVGIIKISLACLKDRHRDRRILNEAACNRKASSLTRM